MESYELDTERMEAYENRCLSFFEGKEKEIQELKDIIFEIERDACEMDIERETVIKHLREELGLC